ncbi:MAG: AAA family ATPase [Bradymonadaceae bacterium]
MGDLKLDDPSSWGRTAGRAFDRVFDTHGLAETAREWRRARGFSVPLELGKPLARRVCQSSATAVRQVFEENDEGVLLVVLPDDVAVVADVSYDGGLVVESIYRQSSSSAAAVERAVGRACWAGARALRVENDGSSLSLDAVDLDEYTYSGERAQLIENWRAFLDHGVSRNVLLQGPPGTGKTTLCLQAARELTDRALCMTGTDLKRISADSWRRIIDVLQPTVAVVDDVDRAGGSAGLEGAEHLKLFAELREEITLLLFTSNDHTALPGALRRPGRIDRIVAFEEPSSEVRRGIVRELADEHGVELDDDRLDWLVGVLEDHSAAHVREALRRASVLGWSAVDTDEQTFRMHREFQSADHWLDTGGYRKLSTDLAALYDSAFERGEPQVAFRGQHRKLEQVGLPNGARLIRVAGQSPQYGRDFWFRIPGDAEGGRSEARAGVREQFWSDRRAVVVHEVEREFSFRAMRLQKWEFFGPRRAVIDRWESFLEADRRRSVLLKGPPGTGKSTLCLHAVRRLSDRTLIFTSNSFEAISENDWQSMLTCLEPEAVIVDDVDRCGHGLESKLRLIEERYCSVPLLLFTCNDSGALPRAMRRPGRIDQIIEFDTPDRRRRREVVDELADREGVEVPDEHVDRVDAVLRHQSPAHAREFLRRADVLGWDAVESVPGDDTFDTTESGDHTDRLEAGGPFEGAAE